MSDVSLSPNGVNSVREISEAAVQPIPVDPGALYATAGHREVLDLERYLPRPRRKTGSVALATVASFEEYLKSHYEPEETTVWVSFDQRAVVGVLDDHSPGDPGFGQHRARVTLQHTDAWKHWTGKNNVPMEQAKFADHIEEGIRELVEPDGATMLEVAQSIHASTSATFRSATRLTDGNVRVQYDEETTASAGQRGELTIPQEFVLAIPPFVGEDPYRITARLRYRIQNGNLALSYKLERTEDVIRDCLTLIAGRLGDSFTRVYLGEPR